MIASNYLDAVRLLVEVAPVIFRDRLFVLKGGTAINLFVREMPRLSVDIDLVVSDYSMSRGAALAAVSDAMESVRRELTEVHGLRCETGQLPDGPEVKLFIGRGRTRVKVEANHVFRGTILPPERRALAGAARNIFFTDLELPVLHIDELYGSKLVAAMDRQHPRDLFDVLGLLGEGSLSAGVVECFVCYLAGHNRPVHEVLFANQIDVAPAFTNEFQGMTREPVPLEDLLELRNRLFSELPAALTERHRAFLLGLVQGSPDWSLMRCPHLRDMAAVRWKTQNLKRLRSSNPAKFASQATELEARL